MSRWFKLTVAYDGTGFAGWQVQPDQPTIQAVLHRAFRRVTKHDITVIGSGRTDAGVHAIAQVASCELPDWNHGATDLARAINSHLPETVVVTDCVDVVDGFHAIRDATGKRYRYQLQIGGLRDPFEHRYRLHERRKLDLNAMQQAASFLLGRHDFVSFQAAGSDRVTTTRDVRACELIVQYEQSDRTHLAIEIEADGFLYNMVRNIVGTLIEVGLSKQNPDWIGEVLNARDRNFAGPTAPPHALFLLKVDYPNSILKMKDRLHE